MYKLCIRPFFFLFNPEQSHAFLSFLLRLPGVSCMLKWLYGFSDHRLEREIFGLRFVNPVGLAAGFDKDAEFFDPISSCGFGFVEVGTVTPKAQPGNEKPRAFRLKKDNALINRMGFNNDGVESMIERLKKRKKGKVLIGGNIGKNKVTPNEEAFRDYEISFRGLYDYVDYFVVNVSSPNTPGLRALQEKEPLKKILSSLMIINKEKGGKPLLLKIAPDLTHEQLDDIVEIVRETGISGVIATNTTLSRDGLKSSPQRVQEIGAGGLSGKPLKNRSTDVVRYLSEKSGKTFPIIASGGIHSPEDALEKINAGASLVQLYTGFIYEGPCLIKRINKAILQQGK